MIWFLSAVGVAFIAFIWYLNRTDGPFEFMDLFIDHSNNRASLAKIMIAWLLVLSTWVVIIKVLGLYKADGIESLLLGLVSIFVGQITVLAAIDRWKGTPDPPKEE